MRVIRAKELRVAVQSQLLFTIIYKCSGSPLQEKGMVEKDTRGEGGAEASGHEHVRDFIFG